MLGERAREQQQLARAEELLRASVTAIAMAGQSIVLISALESLAAVFCAQDRPRHAARLLGTARTARESASAHLRPAQPPDQDLRRSLAQVLGDAAFDAAYREGKLLSPAQALQHAPPGRDDSGQLLHDSFSASPEHTRPCDASGPSAVAKMPRP